jgi:hypothetical protein
MSWRQFSCRCDKLNVIFISIKSRVLLSIHPNVHHKALADLISLIRSAYSPSQEVYTAQKRVDMAIAAVTKDLKWLGYIREHLIQNLSK